MGGLSGIIAKLSGSFATTLLLAYLLPVLLFAFMAAPLFTPLVPVAWAPFLDLFPMGFDQRTLIKISVLGASTLALYNFNIPIIQCYEGYYWRGSWLGKFLMRKHQRKFRDILQAIEDLRKLAKIPDVPAEIRDSLLRDFKQLSLRRDSDYPPDVNNVLPTGLGNAIRCFEQRPLINYGFDAVTFWPHISSLASEKSLENVSEAKRSFDFTLNLAFLCALGAFAAMIAAFHGTRVMGVPYVARWMMLFAGLGAASLVFYRLAVGRALGWGAQVNAVIDLYKSDLIERLGYDPRSVAVLGEKRFWEIAATRIVFPSNPALTFLPPKGGVPGIISAPGPLKIEVIRCVRKTSDDIEVECNVRNNDKKAASVVEVFDDLPPGFAIIAWSVRSSDPRGTLVRTDPLTFRIDHFEPAQTVTFTYRIAPLSAPDGGKRGA